MKVLILVMIIIVFCFFGSFLKAGVFSNLVLDEYIENEWLVGFKTENSFHTQVNGFVTDGDSLNVRLEKQNCDIGNLLTFVYTTGNHPDILELEDKYVSAYFMGEDIVSRILFIPPFLAGHRCVIDLGWIPIESLTKIFLSKDLIRFTKPLGI